MVSSVPDHLPTLRVGHYQQRRRAAADVAAGRLTNGDQATTEQRRAAALHIFELTGWVHAEMLANLETLCRAAYGIDERGYPGEHYHGSRQLARSYFTTNNLAQSHDFTRLTFEQFRAVQIEKAAAAGYTGIARIG